MKLILLVLTLLAFPLSLPFLSPTEEERVNKTRAFPEAEGFGAYTIGGRGGQVLHVTNLNDRGPGSLRDALSMPFPRVIVFDVSGTIILRSNLRVTDGNFSLVGQTAPGQGVCVRGSLSHPGKEGGGMVVIDAPNWIIRYLRFRRGHDGQEPGNLANDSLQIRGGPGIVDHCSISWGADEVLDTSAAQGEDLTVQWSIVSEGCNAANHGFGWSTGGEGNNRFSFHHNLLATNRYRNPNFREKPASSGEFILYDFRNNVRYNWRTAANMGNLEIAGVEIRVNYVANYSKPGPSTEDNHHFHTGSSPRNLNPALTKVYRRDNLMHGVDIGLAGFRNTQYFTLVDKEHFIPPEFCIAEDPPSIAYQRVLQEAGCSFPARDAVDLRIIDHVKNGAGKIIGTQDDVGGWPNLKEVHRPEDFDLDQDGIADAWERRLKLNPADPADGILDQDGDGYTNLEEYLNWLVDPERKIGVLLNSDEAAEAPS